MLPFLSLLSLLACDPGSLSDLLAAPADPPHQGEPAGLIYEIYVRSFQDSDGDGIGDLNGVRARLDHLSGLGVGTIWLMPLLQSFGPAGYDVTDFDTITAAYGSPDDLAALVEEANALDMRVIVDLPFNHVHRSHPWFEAAETGPDSDLRSWFRFEGRAPEGERWFASQAEGSYYAYFGEEMPDLDWERPAVQEAMGAVFDRWLEAGADGYRLDAVLMLVEEGEVVEGSDGSHALMAELYARTHAAHPDTFFLAEASAWEVEDSVSWLGGEDAPESDAVLDFPRRDALLDAVESGEVQALVDLIDTQVRLGGAANMAGFLGSHDVDRLPEIVPDPEARRALRVAQLLLPGAPVLYYGEELDLPNASTGTGQDYAMRAPMPWSADHDAGFTTGSAWFTLDPGYREGWNVADQEADPESMLHLIRALSCLRAAHGLDEDTGWEPEDAGSSVLAFTRDDGRLSVRVNLRAQAADGLAGWGFAVQSERGAGCGL